MKKIKSIRIQGFKIDLEGNYILPLQKGESLEVSLIQDTECSVELILRNSPAIISSSIWLNNKEILDLWNFLGKVIIARQIS